MRIAAAVRPLVVQLDDGDVWREERDAAEDPGPECGVQLDCFELLGCQRAWFSKHVVGNADFADVVEERAEAEDLDVILR